MVRSSITYSEDECTGGQSTRLSVCSEPITIKKNYLCTEVHPAQTHRWHSEPANIRPRPYTNSTKKKSNSPELQEPISSGIHELHDLLEVINEREGSEMYQTLFTLATSEKNCQIMRNAGCISLLAKLIHSNKEAEIRDGAYKTLHNLIKVESDERIRKRELRIFRLLEHVKSFTDMLSNGNNDVCLTDALSDNEDKHPIQTLVHLLKYSTDFGQTICDLGGIHILATMIEMEHAKHGSVSDKVLCISVRKYTCMILANITYSNNSNKAKLCSYRKFIRALVVQLRSPRDDLEQVSASVLRNLTCHADQTSRDVLREVGAVAGLIKAAMATEKENTLKAILTALWNLSAHSIENKAEICAIDGALEFLINMLSYKSLSKTLVIVELSSGIIKNISNQIAVRDDYREILRKHNCLQLLLQLLKSPNVTIVHNACCTLSNLSAKCTVDREALVQMGAIDILRDLSNSKHKFILFSSSAVLKNLLTTETKHNVMKLNKRDIQILKHMQKSSNINNETKFLDSYYKYKSRNTYESGSHSDTSNENLCNQLENLSLSNLGKNRSSSGTFLSYKDVLKPAKSYLPVRNNCSNYVYGQEIDTSEQPMDYSQKFIDVKLANRNFKREYARERDENDDYGVYAETDLDQPTDYSLQYAEDDSDSESENLKSEFVQDTVKTYCTEGTPYQTPFNFSTATSMSDLRVMVNENVDKHIATSTNNIQNKNPGKIVSNYVSQNSMGNGILKSELSSGMMSPEKPVNYCDEGTPGYFSRVSSFESLNSLHANETTKNEEIEAVPVQNKYVDMVEAKPSSSEVAVKAVKFEEVLNYAEETPLMFSRSSSLASLDSIEQHSIQDDRSSVISDFSRLTSGIVSPSELPDSPTQTVPCSPKSRKAQMPFHTQATKQTSLDGASRLEPKVTQKPTIFEDTVIKFKDENTPFHLSTATSLSSLTIDDHDHIKPLKSNNVDENVNVDVSTSMVKNSSVPNSDVVDGPGNGNANDTVEEKHDDNLVSDEDDDRDEDILATCIKMGMQNTRYSPNKNNLIPNKMCCPPVGRFDQKTENLDSSLPHSGSYSVPSNIIAATQTPTNGLYNKKSEIDDSIECLSDDGSNTSADERILAQCIQVGMGKTKLIPSNVSAVSGSPVKQTTSNTNSIQTIGLKKAFGNNFSEYNGRSDSSHSYMKSSQSDCTGNRLGKEVGKYSFNGGCGFRDNINHTRNQNMSHPNILITSPKLNKTHYNTSTECSNVSNTCTSNTKTHLLQEDVSVQDYKIIQQLIQAGMSKVPMSSIDNKSISPKKAPATKSNSLVNSCSVIPNPYAGAKDEFTNYAVENSPCHFSLRSSFSDLTVDGSTTGVPNTSFNEISSTKSPSAPSSPKPNDSLNTADTEATPEKKDCNKLTNSEDAPFSFQSNDVKNPPEVDFLKNISDDDDEEDDRILAACIKIGMESTKMAPIDETKLCSNSSLNLLNGRSSKSPENAKNCPQTDEQSGSNAPLLGFLQTLPPNKLSLRLKKHNKGTKDNNVSHKTNNNVAGASAESTDVRISSQESDLSQSLSNRNLQGDQCHKSLYCRKTEASSSFPKVEQTSRRLQTTTNFFGQDPLSSLSFESFAEVETGEVLLEQSVLPRIANTAPSATENNENIPQNMCASKQVAPKVKQDKRKSKRAIVESMGRAVVDLLKLRKNNSC